MEWRKNDKIIISDTVNGFNKDAGDKGSKSSNKVSQGSIRMMTKKLDVCSSGSGYEFIFVLVPFPGLVLVFKSL